MVALRRNRWITSEEALAYQRKGLAATLEGSGIAQLAFAHFNLGFCLLWARKLGEAETELRESLTLAERIGDATTRIRSLNYLAVVERWRGDVEAARDLADSTLEAARQAEMLEYVATARGQLAWVAWRDGDLEIVEEVGREVVAALDEVFQYRLFGWMPLWPLLGVALARGAEAEAIDDARMILDPTRQAMPPELEAALADAVVAWDGGDPGAARAKLDRAMKLATHDGYL
jgi:hypothetical protein